jgi:hypothetical protein
MLLTKSPIRFARMALDVARRQLPRYRTVFSRHDFEWPQLVACLLVRQFFQLDYRGVEQLLIEYGELRDALELRRVPDHTVLCRALAKIHDEEIEALLDETVLRCKPDGVGGVRRRRRKTVIPDSTGFRWDNASRSFWRRTSTGRLRRWPKWSLAIDRASHVLLSQVADIGCRSRNHIDMSSPRGGVQHGGCGRVPGREDPARSGRRPEHRLHAPSMSHTCDPLHFEGAPR